MSQVSKILHVTLCLIFLVGCTRDRVTGEFILTADPVDVEGAALEREREEEASPEVLEPIVYVVREGDVLSAVAEKFGTTVAGIKNLNPQLTSDRLFPGDEIRVPAPSAAGEGGTAGVLDDKPFFYTIQAGDIVSAIAVEFGVTLDEIREANPLVDLDQVPVGVRLIIPVPAAPLELEDDGFYHTVRAGDTLNDIALRYSVEAKAIQELNNLVSPDQLAVGQRLLLPENALLSGIADPPVQPQGTVTHVVREGDTLTDIALYYQVTTHSIIQANNLLDQDQLAVGETLIIPGVALQVQDGYLTHTVRAGETLSAIAQRYGVSVDVLLSLNQLESADILSAGQQLLIPNIQQ